MLEGTGENIIIQKKEQKNFLFHLCIVDLGIITGFSDELNSVIRQESVDRL